MQTPFILGFTGHRPDKLNYDYEYTGPLCLTIREKIALLLEEQQPTKVIVGGAIGIDEIALQEVLKKEIPVTIAIPFVGHHSRWSKLAQARWFEYLKNPLVTLRVISNTASIGAYQMRNMWMVDNIHKLAAVWDGSEGGTNNCITYAKLIKRDILMMKLNENITV